MIKHRQATNYSIIHTNDLESYNTVNCRYLDVGNNDSIFITLHTTLFLYSNKIISATTTDSLLVSPIDNFSLHYTLTHYISKFYFFPYSNPFFSILLW